MKNALRLEILQHPSQATEIGAALEALVTEGWVIGSVDPTKPVLSQVSTPRHGH